MPSRTSVTDPQRHAVYRWQDAVARDFRGRVPRAYAARATRALLAAYGVACGPVSTSARADHSRYRRTNRSIRYAAPDGTVEILSLLHEASHAICHTQEDDSEDAGGPHGPAFVALLADMMERFLGLRREAIRGWAEMFSVAMANAPPAVPKSAVNFADIPVAVVIWPRTAIGDLLLSFGDKIETDLAGLVAMRGCFSAGKTTEAVPHDRCGGCGDPLDDHDEGGCWRYHRATRCECRGPVRERRALTGCQACGALACIPAQWAT